MKIIIFITVIIVATISLYYKLKKTIKEIKLNKKKMLDLAYQFDRQTYNRREIRNRILDAKTCIITEKWFFALQIIEQLIYLTPLLLWK
jgi:hypothetical protein